MYKFWLLKCIRSAITFQAVILIILVITTNIIIFLLTKFNFSTFNPKGRVRKGSPTLITANCGFAACAGEMKFRIERRISFKC